MLPCTSTDLSSLTLGLHLADNNLFFFRDLSHWSIRFADADVGVVRTNYISRSWLSGCHTGHMLGAMLTRCPNEVSRSIYLCYPNAVWPMLPTQSLWWKSKRDPDVYSTKSGIPNLLQAIEVLWTFSRYLWYVKVSLLSWIWAYKSGSP